MAVKKTGQRRTGKGKRNGDSAAEDASLCSPQTKEKTQRSGYALSDDAVEEALVTGEYRGLLEEYFGEEAYADLRSLATRARSARTRGGPRVLVLPGIMGSKLGKPRLLFSDTIWIDPFEIIAGRLRQLSLVDGSKEVKHEGVLLLAYLKLKLRLKLAGFDASFHPFDWRQSISDLGRELADRIRGETKPDKGREDLFLVAHSMGGLVARAAFKQLKEKKQEKKVRRLIMLGTPNFGSFSPVEVFSGHHSMVRRVAALDCVNSEADLVNKVFNTFPGLYQMLPAPQKFFGVDLYNPAIWPPVGMGPRADLLAAAPKVHEAMEPGNDSFTLIAGINQQTVVGVRREGDDFVFTTSVEGDGTVPLAFAQLPGVETYYIEESHGSLPNHADVARAVIELLETSKCVALPTTWTPRRLGVVREVRGEDLAPEPYGGRRGEQISVREVRQILQEFAAPPARISQEAPPAPAVGFARVTGEPIVVGRKRQRRVDLRLAHGNVTQVDSRALVLGLFKGVAPSGAARAIDEQLNGVITDFTERRMVSANVGEIFIMPANRYRMGADLVVFAGMGTFDDFNEEVLRIVAENIARALARTKVDEFATVLMSTGAGMPVGAVLSNLLEGFLRGLKEGDRDGRLRCITLCEADQERFAQMHAELLRLTATPLFDDLEATVEMRQLPPPPISVRAAAVSSARPSAVDPVYLMVRRTAEPGEKESKPDLDTDFTLRASVLTAGSRATVITDERRVEAAKLNAHLQQIETSSFTADSLSGFGDELARLVLPPVMLKVLPGLKDRQLIVIHDARASRIPWETLCIDGWCPAADAGLSRKYEAEDLSVAGWLDERRLADKLKILLIVNPTADLEGAEREGDRIRQLLEPDSAFQIEELRCEQATLSAVRARFRSGDYDVIHYAGHAFFDPYERSRSGIVCHGRQVLSGRDLIHLEKLPALVFFNACEAARLRKAGAAGEEHAAGFTRRLDRNVGLAEAFLRGGVGNYVGTYWPVGDEAASEFAGLFYKSLVRGESVGSALQNGRKRVLSLKSVDWADYVHYGSPDFVVKCRA